MKPKCVVLLSGGMDSAVAAYWAKERFGQGIALSIWYGQRHKKEIDFSKKLAEKLQFPFTIRTFDLQGICGDSALVDAHGSVNKRFRGLPASFVPGRNLFMLTIAGVLAYQERINYIVGGWNIVDYGGYPDCRPEFLSQAEITLTKAMNYPIKIHKPVLYMNKRQILEYGLELEVPFQLTWSCYEGKAKPCGKCDACKNRAKGFRELKIKDPLLEGNH